jgi:hypothetical protein
MRIRQVAACALAAAALVVAPRSALAANEDANTNTLHTGHCLAASFTRIADVVLYSTSRRFWVDLVPSFLTITDEVNLSQFVSYGYQTWERSGDHGEGRSATLCMQGNGNLVFRVNGVVAWSSRTAGTGAHNYALIRDSGSFVVRTLTGATVWSSHTTAVLMKAGDRLESGHALSNYTSSTGHTHMQMTAGGDLVLKRGTTTVWHTGTHTQGSYLLVTSTGRLAVRTPANITVWHSAAVGGLPVLTVAQLGRITLYSHTTHHCWVRPTGSAGCGIG